LSVIGFDPLEIEAHELGRGELLGQNGAVDVGDRRLLEMKRVGGKRPQPEQ